MPLITAEFRIPSGSPLDGKLGSEIKAILRDNFSDVTINHKHDSERQELRDEDVVHEGTYLNVTAPDSKMSEFRLWAQNLDDARIKEIKEKYSRLW